MHSSEPVHTSPNPLKRWGPLVVLLLAVAAAWWFGLQRYLSLQAIIEHRDQLVEFVAAHRIAAVLLYALVYIVAVALSLPGGAILTICGGFLFGWLLSGSVTVVAATAGATLIFLIAQSSFGDSLVRRAGPWAEKFADGLRKDAFNYLLFLRLVPAFPFWLVNVVPALFGIPLRTYVIATLVGIVPGTFAYSILGSGLDSIIAAERARYAACVEANGSGACAIKFNAGSLITPQIIAAFVALGIVALIPVVLRWRRERAANK